MERTLAILKPDCVEKHLIGKAIDAIEGAGFRLVAMKLTRLSRPVAEEFYAVHRGKAFFEELVAYMTSGPCVPLVLEAPGAVDKFRQLIGPTDPQKAPKGTLRGDYGESIRRNFVHGSDSPENAAREVSFFFSTEELLRTDGAAG
ncbi:MAG: nucleoside-diphosphate kinase [Calditrichaeota bacterium]|nr:nucleoside-diphosphate kinase [Calditrichota bacterium]